MKIAIHTEDLTKVFLTIGLRNFRWRVLS